MDNKSRMSREAHVRFCEGLRVKIPRSTRLLKKTVEQFRFIREHADTFRVTKMCQVLAVSRSGYYHWVKCPKSTRKIEDVDLKQRIVKIHNNSHKTYGSPRIHQELLRKGYHVSKKRVERLMKKAGTYAISKKKYRATPIRNMRIR